MRERHTGDKNFAPEALQNVAVVAIHHRGKNTQKSPSCNSHMFFFPIELYRRAGHGSEHAKDETNILCRTCITAATYRRHFHPLATLTCGSLRVDISRRRWCGSPLCRRGWCRNDPFPLSVHALHCGWSVHKADRFTEDGVRK